MKKIELMLLLVLLMLSASCASDYYYVCSDFSNYPENGGRTVYFEDSTEIRCFENKGWDVAKAGEPSGLAGSEDSGKMQNFRYMAAFKGSMDSATVFFVAYDAREDFRKTFKWLTTEYEYRAVFPQCDLPAAPIEDYLDEEDRNIWLRGEGINPAVSGYELMYRLDDINEKFIKWYNCSYFDFNCSLFSDYVGKRRADSIMLGKNDILSEMTADGFDVMEPAEFGKLLDNYYGGTYYSDLYAANRAVLDSLFRACDDRVEDYFEKYLYFSVKMPGRIVATNARIHDVNSVTWYMYPIRMLDGPVEITAVSRKVNVWACVVTALGAGVLVFFPVSAAVSKKRKKKSRTF